MSSDTLILTLLVKDELDIIRDNIEFHLDQGVDHIIAMDNVSIDGTREILCEYEKQGVLTLIDEPGGDYSQSKWVTRMTMLAKEEFKAKWVINNDADEFWMPEQGNLKDTISQYPNSDLLRCPRKNMVSAYDDQNNEPWHQKIKYRVCKPAPIPPLNSWLDDDLPDPYYYHALAGKVIVNTKEFMTIRHGNHGADFNHTAKVNHPDITIYHYPIRSQEHHIRKVSRGGAAFARNQTLNQSVGVHWRRWYKMLTDKQLERMFADALPSKKRLRDDIEVGTVKLDDTMSSYFQNKHIN